MKHSKLCAFDLELCNKLARRVLECMLGELWSFYSPIYPRRATHSLSARPVCCALHPYEFNPPLQRSQHKHFLALLVHEHRDKQSIVELQDGRTNTVLLRTNSPDLHLHHFHFLTSPVGRSKLQTPPELKRVKNLDIYMFRERFSDTWMLTQTTMTQAQTSVSFVQCKAVRKPSAQLRLTDTLYPGI